MGQTLTSTTEPTTGVHSHVSAVVCAWCQVTLRPGDPARPTSHGVCPRCACQILKGREGYTPLPVPYSNSR